MSVTGRDCTPQPQAAPLTFRPTTLIARDCPAMARGYTIAYIAGLQHCGSTLLDLLLNAHSEAVSVGELFELPDYAHERKARTERTCYGSSCTCGAESIWKCDFWMAINAEFQHRCGLTLRELDINANDPGVFADHNRLFFDCLADVSGAALIVDSSKRLGRLAALLQFSELPVVPIHLLRNPNGQIYSVIKRGQASILQPAISYRRTTLNTLRLLRDVDHVRLRYETLVKEPETALRHTMRRLGMGYEPQQLDWAAAERHNLAGDGTRHTASSDITLRDEWREKLGLANRAVIDLLTLPATYATRRY